MSDCPKLRCEIAFQREKLRQKTADIWASLYIALVELLVKLVVGLPIDLLLVLLVGLLVRPFVRLTIFHSSCHWLPLLVIFNGLIRWLLVAIAGILFGFGVSLQRIPLVEIAIHVGLLISCF